MTTLNPSIPAIAASAVVLMLLAAGCTSGSSADDTPSPAPTSLTTTTEAVDLGLVTTSARVEQRVVRDLPDSVPGVLALSGPSGAVLVDRDTGDETLIASPALLEIGQDPDRAERIVSMVDAGAAGFVVARSVNGESTVELVAPGRTITTLGVGHSPAVAADAATVAWLDGSSVVLADLTGRVLDRVETDAVPTAISWRPDGGALAVGLVDADRTRIVVVDVVDESLGGPSKVPAPVTVDWAHPTWLDDDRLAVIEQRLVAGATFSGSTAEGAARVVVIDLTEDRLDHSSAIDFGVVHADASPDGEVLALTGTDGIVRWWSHGSWGLLLAGTWTSASW